MTERMFWAFIVWCFVTITLGGPACVATCGCAGAPRMAARENARAAVLTLARAAVVNDKACHDIALKTGNIELAIQCADAYDQARPILLAAETAVDAWDDINANRTACALVKALDLLWRAAKLMESAGAKIPSAMEDAVKLATPLTGMCHG